MNTDVDMSIGVFHRVWATTRSHRSATRFNEFRDSARRERGLLSGVVKDCLVELIARQ